MPVTRLAAPLCCLGLTIAMMASAPASAQQSADPAGPSGMEQPDAGQAETVVAPKVRRSPRHVREKSVEKAKPSDLAGRYAVLRDKRDTGCMLTLDDSARVKGGDRAQLAPGCRDQGIVIFDPSAWMIVKGDLVLTARAGHKTVLEKRGEGAWAKDAKDGGKPLGLKKL